MLFVTCCELRKEGTGTGTSGSIPVAPKSAINIVMSVLPSFTVVNTWCDDSVLRERGGGGLIVYQESGLMRCEDGLILYCERGLVICAAFLHGR